MARKQAQNDAFEQTSFLYGANAGFIEELYAKFKRDPASVDAQWRAFFENLGDATQDVIAEAEGAPWQRRDWPQAQNGEWAAVLEAELVQTGKTANEKVTGKKIPSEKIDAWRPAPSQDEIRRAALDSVRALMLIRAYRIRGHLMADLDPLGITEKKQHRELNPATYGFTEADMDRKIFLDNMLGLETASLREILALVKKTYCGTLGIEFMHISDPEQRLWLQKRIEGYGKEISFTDEGKIAILRKLIEAEGFEYFINKKYTGTKRFGIEGAEAMIPALEQIIKRGGAMGLKDIVIGMSHRGRLNVLTTVMAKPARAVFHEFMGGSAHPDDVEGSGDVKYHLGASSDCEFDGNWVHVSLTANPSHLEIVNPVVLGKVRAKQEQHGDKKRNSVMPLLLHGDASFAGQGVVAECLGLSGLKGHRTGGTVHFIINNQIGFTTAPHHSRTSPYPSDVVKMVDSPVFHVNGDDPEAVVHAAKIATEFRQLFGKPVVIDMFCYRRHGHSEGDEPMFTQPLMYKQIKKHAAVVDIYAERLIAENLLTREGVEEIRHEYQNFFESEFDAASSYKPNKADWLDGAWTGLQQASGEARRGETGIDLERLRETGRKLCTIPEGFKPHKTIRRIMEARCKSIETGEGIDWSTAEVLAFGSILNDGAPVRLSGQDSERGTFSQRHSVLNDQETEDTYIPLNNIRDGQGHYEVINSMLSEEAVLGFEYGFSLAEPNALVLWEAQFGDFANGAQVVIDQFISAGERKWLRMSGLVMLLPHGYEGQGPEHSSARLERFLQLCAEDNMQIANCTTPMNYFHALRRQLIRDFRKPLILMTPKSLLRHKRCVSKLEEMGPGTTFHRILWDDAEFLPRQKIKLVSDKKICRVVLCSGKVYYDLYQEREERDINDVYLLRLEQLYPFPAKALIKELARFPQAEIVWCQEEPKNMGAWTFVEPNIEWVLRHIAARYTRARYAGRAASASTATGLFSTHMQEQNALMHDALTV